LPAAQQAFQLRPLPCCRTRFTSRFPQTPKQFGDNDVRILTGQLVIRHPPRRPPIPAQAHRGHHRWRVHRRLRARRIGSALPFVVTDLKVSAIWQGLIGASALIGIFVGGPIFGWLTDRFGRRLMFTIDMVLFLVGSILQFFVGNAWELFASE
jgi:hypothetical protein